MSLVTIRPGVAFRDDAAASFRRLERDLGRQADVNRTTDSYDLQLGLYNAYQAYLAGKGPWAPLALHPDKSNHVYKPATNTGGTAWDTDDRDAKLAEHGWIADVPTEPWHRDYIASRDQHRNDPAPASTPTAPATHTPTYPQEEDMDTRSIITQSVQAPKFELLRGSKRSISKAEWAAMRAVEEEGGPKLAVAIVPVSVLNGIPGK